MSQTSLNVAREPGIVTLTLDGPSNANRLTPDALKELVRLVNDLEKDEATQVVIITGSGKEFFSAGVLSPAIRGNELSKEEIVEMIKWGNKLFDQIEALPQVVIAALNGEARAG